VSSPNTRSISTLLIEEKPANPSSYALVVLSEGAEWEGYQVREYGEADAYSHRKKASAAECLATKSSGAPARRRMVSDLTYDLRHSDPDFVDKLVGLTFGNMALIPSSGRASWTSPLCTIPSDTDPCTLTSGGCRPFCSARRRPAIRFFAYVLAIAFANKTARIRAAADAVGKTARAWQTADR
jgi:hypothetical protein